jgi:hypothetical protein
MLPVGLRQTPSTPLLVAPLREARQVSPKVSVSARDAVSLSPRTAAVRTAQVYADTAMSSKSTTEKMAVFRERFHPGVQFEDPMFGRLSGRQVFGKLATEHAGGAEIRYLQDGESEARRMSPEEIARIDPSAAGEAWHEVGLRWVADYEVGGRPIHNEVTTKLAIDAQGRILPADVAYQTTPCLSRHSVHEGPCSHRLELSRGPRILLEVD